MVGIGIVIFGMYYIVMFFVYFYVCIDSVIGGGYGAGYLCYFVLLVSMVLVFGIVVLLLFEVRLESVWCKMVEMESCVHMIIGVLAELVLVFNDKGFIIEVNSVLECLFSVLFN